MLKEQNTSIFVAGIVAFLVISSASPIAEAALDIDAIVIDSGKYYRDGTPWPSTNPWRFNIWVKFVDTGSLDHIDITLPGGSTPFTGLYGPDYRYESPTQYPTLGDLQTVYPTGIYKLEFKNSTNVVLKTVELDYSGLSEPSEPVNFTYPVTHGQTGISTNPTFGWTVDSGAADALGMWVYDSQGVTDVLVYESVPVTMTTNSWSPGPLQPATEFILAVSVFKAKDLEVGPAFPIETVDGDEFEYCLSIEYCNDLGFTTVPELTIEATIDIVADTITPKTKWITCHIWLPEGYDVTLINPNSIRLEETIPAVRTSVRRKQQMLVANFPRAELNLEPNPDPLQLTVSGELTDETPFVGNDFVMVVEKKGGKKN